VNQAGKESVDLASWGGARSSVGCTFVGRNMLSNSGGILKLKTGAVELPAVGWLQFVRQCKE